MDVNSDFKNAYSLIKLNLDFFGLWPMSRDNFLADNLALIHGINIFFIIFIPRSIAFLLIFGQTDVMIQSLSTNIPCILSLVKLYIFYKRKKVLENMLTTMSCQWNNLKTNEDIQIMCEANIISRNLIISSIILNWSFCTICGVVQLLYNMERVLIIDPDPRLNLQLFWVSYFPFANSNHNIIYTIVMALQMYGTASAAVSYACFDMLIWLLIIQLCGQCKIVQRSLKNLEIGDESQNYWSNLRTIVKKHQQIIKFTETLEETFNFVLLLQLIGCTLSFSLQAQAILMSVQGHVNILQIGMAGILMIGSILQLFLYCWTCEMLISESLEISYSFYQCKWYNLPFKKAKCLTIIGYGSSKPLHLTGFKVFKFSFNLFINVMKTSLSYLSVLIALQNKNI